MKLVDIGCQGVAPLTPPSASRHRGPVQKAPLTYTPEQPPRSPDFSDNDAPNSGARKREAERRRRSRPPGAPGLQQLDPGEDEAVPGRIALAHDYLNQRGGAERVALELAEMHPSAVLATSLYRPDSTFPAFGRHRIRTSFLDRLPVDRGFRALLPLYPAAMRDLGPVEADVLISSSSGWAHGIRSTPGTFHAVYCHNPARWLYGASYMGNGSKRQALAAPAVRTLRRWDQNAAARADLYIANSANTSARIRRIYGRDSVVVPPPVDLERFTPRPRGERLLVVSRLLPYKRVDLVVRAATEAGLPLDVIGEGPMLGPLRDLAGPTVEFHGKAGDSVVTELMETCRAFCLPGEEDFGITPVEAQAAGKPVIAYQAGGALETVVDGYTGTFFPTHTMSAFLDALRRCDEIDTGPADIARHAEQFSRRAFRVRLAHAVAVARGLADGHGRGAELSPRG